MKIIFENQIKKIKNSKHCTAIEYPLKDKDINGSIIKLIGRYPDKGRVVNLKCKELVYVINGFGTVAVEDKEITIQEGDLVFIEPCEKYFWNGNLTLFIASTPAWYLEQHKEVQ